MIWVKRGDPAMTETADDTVSASRLRIGGPLAVAAMTLGMLTFPIAFNLGAYDAVFYDDIFRVVVASTILLVITFFDEPYGSPWMWLVRIALASPMAWFLAAGFAVGSTGEAVERPGFAIWLILVAVVSVPVTLRLLADLFMPDLSREGSRRMLIGIVSLVAVVGLAGYVAGNQHPRFMTCNDFAVAGSSEPDGCVR
jgi:hypothetical protein